VNGGLIAVSPAARSAPPTDVNRQVPVILDRAAGRRSAPSVNGVTISDACPGFRGTRRRTTSSRPLCDPSARGCGRPRTGEAPADRFFRKRVRCWPRFCPAPGA
jgi:hypothetical protein